MARVFIYDRDEETIKALTAVLECQGHDVYSNMGPLTVELRPVNVLRLMLEQKPLPDVILVECLDVDSEGFISMLKSTSLADNMAIVGMTHKYPNGKIERLMESYGIFSMPKPFNLSRMVNFVHELTVAQC